MTEQTYHLTDREQQVLTDLVDIYTNSGQPVGSKALTEHSKLGLSGASYRNIMRDIEEMGLLTHPHTSAGRVPTAEGFRFYAKNLVRAGDPSKKMKEELQSIVRPGRDLNVMLNEVSQTLSRVSGCTGLIMAPKRESDQLEKIEFLRLSGDQVLAVLVSNTGRIENRVIHVPAFVNVDDLNSASAKLKEVIANQTLADARNDLLTHLAEQRGRINEVIDQMMHAAHEWGEPSVTDGALMVAGSTNLFQYPELVRERLQKLISMFEEKRLLMGLMEEVQRGDGVQIFVGKDAPVDIGEDTTLIASSYGDGAQNGLGTLGVIGPLRMDYKQTIGLVDFTSKLLSDTISETQNTDEE
jgi:heat-inducible transcriptional repressor